MQSPVVISTGDECKLSFRCGQNFLEERTAAEDSVIFTSSNCAIYYQNQLLLPSGGTSVESAVPTFPTPEETDETHKHLVWAIAGVTAALFLGFISLLCYLCRKQIYRCKRYKKSYDRDIYAELATMPIRRRSASFRSLPAADLPMEEDDQDIHVDIVRQPAHNPNFKTKNKNKMLSALISKQ